MATLQEAHRTLYEELQSAYRLEAEGNQGAANLLQILIPLFDLAAQLENFASGIRAQMWETARAE